MAQTILGWTLIDMELQQILDTVHDGFEGSVVPLIEAGCYAIAGSEMNNLLLSFEGFPEFTEKVASYHSGPSFIASTALLKNALEDRDDGYEERIRRKVEMFRTYLAQVRMNLESGNIS